MAGREEKREKRARHAVKSGRKKWTNIKLDYSSTRQELNKGIRLTKVGDDLTKGKRELIRPPRENSIFNFSRLKEF